MAKKQATKYGFIGFRPASGLQDKRLRALAEKTGMSISQIVKECVHAHLAHLERSAGLANSNPT